MITEDAQMCENCEERAATHLKRGEKEERWLCNECDPEWKAREAIDRIARIKP